MDLEDFEDWLNIALKNQIEACIEEGRFGSEWKDEVWNRHQVACFLGVSIEAVSAAVKKKEIPAIKVGREYRFLKSQLIKIFKIKK